MLPLRKNELNVVSLEGGFTMIELLMVIMLVAILGAAALPQFLDFRNEARIAAVQKILGSFRTGIKLQTQNAILRCGQNYAGMHQRIGPAMEFNSVITGGLCTTAQITNPAEAKIVESDQLPANPFNGLNSVYQWYINDYVLEDACPYLSVEGYSPDGLPHGWIMINFEIFAASNVVSECAL